MRAALVIVALTVLALAQQAFASKPGLGPAAMPQATYEEFVAAAKERFPGPFDDAAFRRDHLVSDWKAMRTSEVIASDLTYKVDGLSITGVVVRPRAGKRLPILIWARGGVGEARIDPPQLVEMGWWARHGYLVIASNYRGAGGSEGKDEFGGADVNDLVALVAIARKYRQVDVRRIYGVGFSRGGMMLLRAAAFGLPVRALATAGAPTDLASWIGERPDVDALLRRMAPDYEPERRSGYCRRSATCWAERLAVPVYLAHGGDDRSVPPSQAVLLSKRLEQLGRPHRLSILDGADHGISGRRMQFFEEVHRFFSTAR
ncbi:MAG TPA: alpha/beta fold hydrolase [Allosphingosinicella sp.]|jgi:dipeptidyl aminopeptidase/acylaminoacyl peptidase